jgi:6-phosphofructokinase
MAEYITCLLGAFDNSTVLTFERFLQGGRPSPFDRNLGTKMAAKCVTRLIQQIEESVTETGTISASEPSRCF